MARHVIGEEVEVLHVGQDNNRRELIATCQRNGRRYEVALLDIDISADPATSRLVAALAPLERQLSGAPELLRLTWPGTARSGAPYVSRRR